MTGPDHKFKMPFSEQGPSRSGPRFIACEFSYVPEILSHKILEQAIAPDSSVLADTVLLAWMEYSDPEKPLISTSLVSPQLLSTSFVTSSLIAQDALRGSFFQQRCSDNS